VLRKKSTTAGDYETGNTEPSLGTRGRLKQILLNEKEKSRKKVPWKEAADVHDRYMGRRDSKTKWGKTKKKWSREGGGQMAGLSGDCGAIHRGAEGKKSVLGA